MCARSHSLLAAAVAAAGLMLAGCSTQTAGTAEVPATAHSGTVNTGNLGTTPAPTNGSQPAVGQSSDQRATDDPGGVSAGVAIDPQAWAQKLQDGMKTVTSLRGTITVDGTLTETATVKETLDDGRLKAADLAMKLAGGGSSLPLNMRLVDGKTYLGGEGIISLIGSKATGRQWVLLDAGSSDPTLAAVAKTLGSMQQLAGTDSYVFFAKAAKSITIDGREKVGSFVATKYRVDIDLTKIAAVFPPEMKDYGQQIEASGMKDLKSVYWIDDKNRMVKTMVAVTAAGLTQNTTMTIDAFNEPVTIEAPAASTVYTG